MKNTEWGATVYLSKSIYGKHNEEVWNNPANNFMTGCAGDSHETASTPGCLRTYSTENGQQTSTTGNIYGVCDMRGGNIEYVAAYIENDDANLNQDSVLRSALPQYRDVYSSGSPDTQANNYPLLASKKGDAMWETSSIYNGMYAWFSDHTYMPNTGNPRFVRGAKFKDTSAGGVFHFTCGWGGSYNHFGFRPVLAVGAGL